MLQPRLWMAMALTAGLAGACLAAPAPVSAALIRVGPGAFATIQQAINNATPETVIEIAPGTYPENLDLATMGSAVGAVTGDLVLLARDGPGTVQLTGSGVKLGSSAVFEGTLSVDGLSFSSADEDAIRLGSFVNLAISDSAFGALGNDDEDSSIELDITSGAPHVVVYNNSFGAGGAPGSAVRIASTASSSPIVTIQDNTLAQPAPLRLNAPRVFLTMLGADATVTVRDNTLNGITGIGMLMQFGEAGDKSVDVRDNSISGVGSVGISVTATRGGSLDATVANNSIVDSFANAIELDAEENVTALIRGNRITNTQGAGITAGARGAVPEPITVSMTIENNTVTRSARSGISVLAGGASTISALVRNNTIQQPATSGLSQFSGFSGTSSDTGKLKLAASANTVAADPLGRSVLLTRGVTGVTEVEGNTAVTVEQTVAADNTLAGSVAVVNGVTVATRGGVVPIAEPVLLAAVDDVHSAATQVPDEIDVLANDTNNQAALIAFVEPLSDRDGFVTAGDTVNYTSAAGYTGTDEVLYVGRIGNVTGVGRISITVRQPPPRTPRSLSRLNYLPLVGR